MTSNISTKLVITLGVLLSTLTTSTFAAANPLKGNPFINSSSYLLGDQDDDKDQDKDTEPDQDCDTDKNDDKGDQNGGRSDYDDGDKDQDTEPDKDCDKGDQDQDQDQDVTTPTMRVDCRYHNAKGDDKEYGAKFCYASAVYSPVTSDEDGSVSYTNLQLGVGCDQQTIYNNSARVHTETVSERISPKTAAFPAVEIFPQGALMTSGTYESVLDIKAGRLAGVCYVHPIE